MWFFQDSHRSCDCFYSELNSTSGQDNTKSRTWQNSEGLVNIWLLLSAIKDRPLPSPIRLLIWPHLHVRMFRWPHVQHHCSKAKETQVQKLRTSPFGTVFLHCGSFWKKYLDYKKTDWKFLNNLISTQLHDTAAFTRIPWVC